MAGAVSAPSAVPGWEGRMNIRYDSNETIITNRAGIRGMGAGSHLVRQRKPIGEPITRNLAAPTDTGV
jgi:hypothetical protein